ncbi:MAG: Rieske 2Fe-2S domain-containing protein [Candidatus Caldarchaeum sp.]
MSYLFERLKEIKAWDFEPVIWNACCTVLKSRDEKLSRNYLDNLLTMLDFTIYGLSEASAESEEIASDPYLYHTLGVMLTYLTRSRRQLLNIIETTTGYRPKLVERAYKAFRECVANAEGMADILAATKLCYRLLVTAARAGIFYSNNQRLREVLLTLTATEYDFNTYMDDFIGKYRRDPDVVEPSNYLAGVVLELCMKRFPKEAVEETPPSRWVEACDVKILEELGKRLVIVDGWLELLIVRTMGRTFAVENMCTHEGGFLSDGFVETYSVSCIDHLAKFDVRTGRVLTHPHHGRARPLATFPTKIEDGRVLVGLYTS